MFDHFTFDMPYSLLLIPLFILLHRLKSSHVESYYMPHIRFLTHRASTQSKLPALCKWMMVISSIVALSDPIIYKEIKSVKTNAIDIVLALDTSGSMSLYGFNPDEYDQTRLDVIKEVLGIFLDKRKDDRLGLVVFGTYSSMASPLSFDKEAQKSIVQGLQIGALGKSTALVDAIVSSVKLLKESQSQSKIIILLSDGEDSSSKTPLPIALKLAQKYGIKIYPIIIDKTQSNMMELIAKASHTRNYNPKDKEALQKVYDEIDQLEKSKLDYESIRKPQPLYAYFLSVSLLCAMLLLLISPRREIV